MGEGKYEMLHTFNGRTMTFDILVYKDGVVVHEESKPVKSTEQISTIVNMINWGLI